MNNNRSSMIIIVHVNDKMKPKFQNFLPLQLLSSRCTSLKQNIPQNDSQNKAILISNDFIVP